MLLGSISRFIVGRKWKFIETDAGGYVIAAFTGMGILGGGIIESGSLSMQVAVLALVGTLTAMGLHGPAKALKKKMVAIPNA